MNERHFISDNGCIFNIYSDTSSYICNELRPIRTKTLFYSDVKRVHIEYVLLKKGSVYK